MPSTAIADCRTLTLMDGAAKMATSPHTTERHVYYFAIAVVVAFPFAGNLRRVIDAVSSAPSGPFVTWHGWYDN